MTNEVAREQLRNEMIEKQLAVYDAEVMRGIVHDRAYVIKMEQYRLGLSVPAPESGAGR